MSLQALIFDMDGTLIDTEELHRQAFNAAFIEMGLFWDWGPHQYAELLKISGGPERLRHYVASLPADAGQRDRLLGLVPAIHRTKTTIYRVINEMRAKRIGHFGDNQDLPDTLLEEQ